MFSLVCLTSLSIHGLLSQGGRLGILCTEVGCMGRAHCFTHMLWTGVAAAVHFGIRLIGI